MVETVTKRLTLLALLPILPGVFLLSWWAWKGFEDDLMAEVHRIHHFEELAAYHVVNNLGFELFHLNFTARLGVTKASRDGADDWPRQIESMLADYREQAHYPDLLKDVVLVADPPVGPRRWLAWSADGWVPVKRPAWVPAGETLFDQAADPVVDVENPVMVVALPERRDFRQVLLLHYDVDKILGEIVPDLVRRAFDDSRSNLIIGATVFRQAASPLVSASDADLTVPLVPKAKFSDWLRNYLGRSNETPPGAEEVSVTPQPYQGKTARWALRVSLEPAGLQAYVAKIRARNLWWAAGVLFSLLAGLAVFLFSGLRLLQAGRRERAFSSLVSHELKTPVAAIRSLSENLSEGVVTETRKVADYGALIVEQTQRLSEMIGNILTLSSLDAATGKLFREEFDAAGLVRQAAQAWNLPAGIAEGPWVVRGNRAAAQAALDNLITNALRYGVKDGEKPLVALALLRDRSRGIHWVGLSVTDHGPGLDRAEIRRVFEPFRRGRQADRRQVPGGGIGLSLVRATMRHLGGRVQLRSVPGGGLTVVLWLRQGGRFEETHSHD
jgi:signal transduction histidine kinase